jgi:hypothetical protein
LVQYDRSYGDTLVLPGSEEALVIVNSSDNMGPPRTDSVIKVFADLAAQFPGAEIRASTLDNFVPALRQAAADLPELTEEIGDTWIHGVGTDPGKVARFRELLRLRKAWEADGRLSPDSPSRRDFYDELIMISEHTWGLDLKKHLGDFVNWSADDFHAARKRDSSPAVSEEYAAIRRHAEAELEALYPDNPELRERRSYSFFESSHREQRAYLDAAVKALPLALGEEAVAAFKALEPERSSAKGSTLYPGAPFVLGPWQAVIGDSGAVVSLVGEDGRELAGPKGIGAYSYQTFSYEDFVRYHQDYNRDMDRNAAWAGPDFGKPGMQYARPRPINAFYHAHIHSIHRQESGDGDLVEVKLLASVRDPRGAPKELIIRYRSRRCSDTVELSAKLPSDQKRSRLEISLDWFDKEAGRLPEAIWFGVSLNVATPGRWRFRKLGTLVDPLDVVKGGNRSYHAITEAEYQGCDGAYRIIPLDSPLAAIGKPKMLCFDEHFEDPAAGVYFNIFNNIWGTNFPMWLEGDGRSRFAVEF